MKPRARVTVIGDDVSLGLHAAQKHELLVETPRADQLAAAAADVLVVVAGTELVAASAWLTLLRLHGVARVVILHRGRRDDDAEARARAELTRLGFEGDEAHVVTARADDERAWLGAVDDVAERVPRTGFLAVRRDDPEWPYDDRPGEPPSAESRRKARRLLGEAQRNIADASFAAARMNARLAHLYDRAALSTLVDVVWGELPEGEHVCRALIDGEVPVVTRLHPARAGDPSLIGLVRARVVTNAKVSDAMAVKSRAPLPAGAVHVYGNGGGHAAGRVEGEWIRLDAPILFASTPRVAVLPWGEVVDVELE